MQVVYKIRNKINGKFYIGRSNDYRKRWRTHSSLLRRGIHHSIHLQRAYNKYGKKAFVFEIYKVINDPDPEREDELAKEIEQEFLDRFIGTNQIYNRSRTSQMGVVLVGSEHSHYKKHPRDWMGESFDNEIERKKTLTGEKNHFFGKQHTEDVKKKISETKKQNPHVITDEFRRKLKEAGIGRSPTVWQSIMVDGKVYRTISDASKETGVNRATLRQRALDDRFPNYILLDKKDDTTLTSLQRHCAELIATIGVHKMTMQQIADEIGINRTTVFRWKKDPEFIAYQNSVANSINN